MEQVGAEVVRVLPGDPGWLHRVAYLDEKVLGLAAGAAYVRGDDVYGLPALTFDTAAGLIGRLTADLTTATPTTLGTGTGMFLAALPAWELDTLWQTHALLRRAADREPDTEELAELLDLLGQSLFDTPHTIEDFTADLEHLLAILTLDTPAVRMVATALTLGHAIDARVRHASGQIQDCWKGTGLHG
ncbi:hypothetical protein ABT160_41960 [Streptomyces sp. NPDC001941]|uniref:hypothetical protein n=1 Tax=Streptomyces sp. NPDC001941 TaxID=3154659 RepID=UPI003316931C